MRRGCLSATIELEVPFHDLDPLNVVWHGHYVKYLELARDALMRQIGFSHREIMQSGIVWPVVEMKVRYLQALRLGDRLRVTARLLEYDPRLKFVYDIDDARTGRRCTRAYTMQVPVTMPGGKLQFPVPDSLRVPVERALRLAAARSNKDER